MRITRIFDGWYVVASVFVLLMVNAGLGFYGLSIFLEAITDEQGFSTASVSFATSLFFIVSALSGRLIAPVIERHDLRLIVAAGGVVAAGGLLLIGESTSLFTLYISYVVFAVGAGLSGLVPATTLVTRWFQARRSVALSIASTGLSVGGLTVTVVASRLIDSKGMQDAAPWMALIYLAMVALSLITLWPDPAKRGQLPDGIAVDDSTAATSPPGIAYDEAVRSRVFLLITIGFVLTMGAQVGGIAQLAKLGSERVDTATGTLLLSSIAFASVLARLIGGAVASRVSLVAMTTVMSVGQCGSLIWLSQGQSRAMLVVGALLFGCTIGNLLMLHPLVLADRFGVASYARIYALSQLIVVGFGVAGGPYLLGALHDLWSYQVSYIAAGFLSVCGVMAFAAALRIDTTRGLTAEVAVLGAD